MDCSPSGSSVHGISQVRILEWVAISSSRGSSQPGIESMSLALAGGFFTTEPAGKWKVKVKLLSRVRLCDPVDCSPPGSSVRGILQARILECVAHFLLYGIFPTQGLNPRLLHCRQMLYPLSHQRSTMCQTLNWESRWCPPYSTDEEMKKSKLRISFSRYPEKQCGGVKTWKRSDFKSMSLSLFDPGGRRTGHQMEDETSFWGFSWWDNWSQWSQGAQNFQNRAPATR